MCLNFSDVFRQFAFYKISLHYRQPAYGIFRKHCSFSVRFGRAPAGQAVRCKSSRLRCAAPLWAFRCHPSRSLHRNIIFMKVNLLYARQGRTQIPPTKKALSQNKAPSQKI